MPRGSSAGSMAVTRNRGWFLNLFVHDDDTYSGRELRLHGNLRFLAGLAVGGLLGWLFASL